MRQPAFIVATLTGSLLFGVSVAGALRAPADDVAAAPDGYEAQASADSAATRTQAALAAAISGQFPGRVVDVELVAPVVPGEGSVQQEVQALARVRIDGSAPMLVRASALYDLETQRIAAPPSLSFEGKRDRPAPAAVRDALDAAATRRLDAEFAGQAPALALADAEAVAVGGRYLSVTARGTVDFGAEGRADTTIHALYDPRAGEWLRLDYTLGADPAEQGNTGFAYAGT